MVDDGLGNDQRVGIGKEAINNTLHGHHLGGELRRSFGIPIEPSLNEIKLVAEVEGSRAEGRRVERSLLETNGTSKTGYH
jgi:hypothetical protein